jgi:surface polysaccharide O-acyltransferase-like enzyme
MNRQNGIDLFRIIAAFFIMILHADSFGDLDSEYVNNFRLLGRWAVPFYFIVTGYFIEKKIDNRHLDFTKIQNNISKLITILIVSSLIYIPINIAKGRLFYQVDHLLTGSYFHLWFIGSLLFGYIFIWYLFFIKKNKFLPYIAVLLLLLAIITDSYDQFLGLNISFNLFRFLLSIPFLYIGIVLSRKKASKVNKKVLFAILIIGIIIQLFEVNLLSQLFGYDKYLHQFLFGTIIIVIPIFILSSMIKIKESKLVKWGRQHSLFIYLFHPMIYLGLGVFIHKFFPNYTGTILMFSPIIGFIIILFIAILFDNYFPKIYKLLNGNLGLKNV